jgi:hypothetical protein
VGERDADGVVDPGSRGERGIEALAVERAHDLEADRARDFPVKFAAGKLAAGLAANVDREGRADVVEELLGVVVGEDDPEVGLERLQPRSDVGRDLTHVLDIRLVLGVRHGEELRRMRQHGAADHSRHHDSRSVRWPRLLNYRAGVMMQQARLFRRLPTPAPRHGRACPGHPA